MYSQIIFYNLGIMNMLVSSVEMYMCKVCMLSFLLLAIEEFLVYFIFVNFAYNKHKMSIV